VTQRQRTNMRGLFAGLWILATLTTVASQESDPTTTTTTTLSAVEDTIAQETIAEGRGERDEIGIREEWETPHIGEKHDSRRPISPKVQRLLTTYRLDCSGCDHTEATLKVNEFVRTAQREAEIEERKRAVRDQWLARLARVSDLLYHPWAIRLGFVCLACNLLLLAYLYRTQMKDAGKTANLRSYIEVQQQRAAAEERLERAKAESRQTAAPSWIENEQKEVWTAKQEKQFTKALREFGGVGKKERYSLIADQVVEKTKLECLMHHKLLQVNNAKEHRTKETLAAQQQENRRNAAEDEEKKATAKPWSKEELTCLAKATKKYPAGGRNRWDAISNFISNSSVPRSKEDCIAQYNILVATSTTAPVKAPAANDASKAEVTAAVETYSIWTEEQDTMLQDGLAKFPSKMDTNERWSQISTGVKGKSKKECVSRYKAIREALKKKK